MTSKMNLELSDSVNREMLYIDDPSIEVFSKLDQKVRELPVELPSKRTEHQQEAIANLLYNIGFAPYIFEDLAEMGMTFEDLQLSIQILISPDKGTAAVKRLYIPSMKRNREHELHDVFSYIVGAVPGHGMLYSEIAREYSYNRNQPTQFRAKIENAIKKTSNSTLRRELYNNILEQIIDRE